MPIEGLCFMISTTSFCLVLKILSSSRMPTSFHRSLSVVHNTGKYKRQSTCETCLPAHRQPMKRNLGIKRFAHIATILTANPALSSHFFTRPLSSISNPESVCLGNNWETSFTTWSITARVSPWESLIK